MRNRIMSLILLFALVFTVITPVMSFAQDDLQISVIEHKVEDYKYLFKIEFQGRVVKGQKIELTLPFTTSDMFENLETFFEVNDTTQTNDKVTLTAKQSGRINRGTIDGSKIIYNKDEIKDIKINGVVSGEKPEWTGQTPSSPELGDILNREPLTKHGMINSSEGIDWIITAFGGEEGSVEYTITDVIGEGQQLLEDTFNISLFKLGKDSSGNISRIEEESLEKESVILTNPKKNEFTIKVPKLEIHQFLEISYKTKVTQKLDVYENSLESEKPKITSKVEFEGGSSIDFSETIDVKVQKRWELQEDSETPPVEEVIVQLKNSKGEIIKEIALSKNNNWEFEVKDLIKDEYQIEEVTKLEGFVTKYETGENGELIVVNSEEPENPDPDNPEPTDPNLPQVGEEFNILAIGLLAVGLFQLIRSER